MATSQRLTQAERIEISDRLMLETAIRLIVENGPDKTTLKDVGELAGFSRSLAGHRFGNKTGLFEFVIRSIGEIWLEELKQATESLSGYPAIAAAINAYYEMFQNNPDHMAALYTLWFSNVGEPSDIRAVIVRIHNRRRADVAKWVQQGIDEGSIDKHVDADAIAALFSTSIIGIVYQWLLNPEDIDEVNKLLNDLKHTISLWLGFHMQPPKSIS